MVWRVERAEAVNRDLELIFDFLFDAAVAFGEDTETAFDRAATRISAIQMAAMALAEAPYQGTLREDIAPGLRQVTKERAVFYFELDADARCLRLLAVFFGGQDHRRHMLRRLLLR